MQLIYSAQGPMRVAGLFSGGASSIQYMLGDPNHGKLYVFTGAATNKEDASGIAHLKPHMDVQTFLSPKEYCERKGLDWTKLDTKYRYWEGAMQIIQGFEPDVIALSGLMLIVRYPVITEVDKKTGQVRKGAFENSVFNVHPADLAILTDPSGLWINAANGRTTDVKSYMQKKGIQRKYRGDDAVTDAMNDGERNLRSTIHIATREVDDGLILVRSASVDVSDIPAARAKDVQEYMKWHCDGPSFAKAMELVAGHRLGADASGTAFMMEEDGLWRELPYGGYTMEGRLVPELK